MKPKPAGLGPQYATQFNDPSVVAAYTTRPPYPAGLLSLILDLAGTSHRRILDLGSGTGELARRLAPRAQSITAIDHSDRMIAQARALPGGDAPNIEWIAGRVEDVELSGTFSLALAAESFHWFDWGRVCPRLIQWVPSRLLLLVEDRRELPSPWSGTLASLIADFSTNREFQPYDLVSELAVRSCFSVEGRTALGPEVFMQSVDDYITSIHSRNGFSRDRMAAQAALRFDRAVREATRPYAKHDALELRIETRVAWGRVLNPEGRWNDLEPGHKD